MSMELGRVVQQRREELGLGRRELAERSDVSYPYLSQIETGDRDPSLRVLRKLSEALEVPVEQLAGLVSPSAWLSESTPRSESVPLRTSTVTSLRTGSWSESVDAYRESVLPSVERKLAKVPPLIRLQLLAELMAVATKEASGGAS